MTNDLYIDKPNFEEFKSRLYDLSFCFRNASDELKIAAYEKIKDQKWWVEFVNYVNALSPIRKEFEYVLFNLLTNAYSPDKNSMRFEDANKLFKLIIFKENVLRSSKGSYAYTERENGKHVIYLSDFEVENMLHEIIHSTHGHIVIDSKIPKEERKKPLISNPPFAFFQEYIARLGSFMPIRGNFSSRDILDDIKKGSYNNIKEWISLEPDLFNKLVNLAAQIPNDPVFILVLNEILHNFLNENLDSELSTEEVVDKILDALIETEKLIADKEGYALYYQDVKPAKIDYEIVINDIYETIPAFTAYEEMDEVNFYDKKNNQKVHIRFAKDNQIHSSTLTPEYFWIMSNTKELQQITREEALAIIKNYINQDDFVPLEETPKIQAIINAAST